MKKVLVYENRKTPMMIWDASTPKLEEKAFFALFKELGGYWDCYCDLKYIGDPPVDPSTEIGQIKNEHLLQAVMEIQNRYDYYLREYNKNKQQATLYKRACDGDFKALKQLMQQRKDYEYEEWDLVNVLES